MELWKDIPEYENLYQASTHGRIRTCEGKTTASARFPHRVWKQRIMKQKMCANKRGRTDARISLWKDGKEKSWLVSRLVAMTWCDGYAEGMTVNHINGNPLDNTAKNLEWVSLIENIKKGFSDGLYNSVQNPVSLIADGEITTFDSMSEASRFLGRNHGYIHHCLKHNRKATDHNGKQYDIVVGGVA